MMIWLHTFDDNEKRHDVPAEYIARGWHARKRYEMRER